MLEHLLAIIAFGGVLGVGLLMFAENLFPPIPSEVIMPLAGFLAARGEVDFLSVVAAGTAGAVGGAYFWYGVGRWIGESRLMRWAARHGHWLTLQPADVDRAVTFFRRHGGPAVFLGRLVPAVRTYISVPAGVAVMPVGPFLAWTTGGTAIWTLLLAYAGYRLEAGYARVADWLGPVSTGVIALGILAYLVRVAVIVRRRGGTS